jgi:hypothetical protein
MPVDPFVSTATKTGLGAGIAGLAGAGLVPAIALGALGAVPDILAARAEFTKSDKERLAELERLAARNALGLTSKEEAVLQNQLLTPAQALARQQMLEQRQLLSATGAESGTAFQQMLAKQAKDQDLLQQAEQKVAEADLAKAQKQREEMLALQRAEDKAKLANRSAIIGAVANIGTELFGLSKTAKRAKEETGVANSYENSVLGE